MSKKYQPPKWNQVSSSNEEKGEEHKYTCNPCGRAFSSRKKLNNHQSYDCKAFAEQFKEEATRNYASKGMSHTAIEHARRGGFLAARGFSNGINAYAFPGRKGALMNSYATQNRPTGPLGAFPNSKNGFSNVKTETSKNTGTNRKRRGKDDDDTEGHVPPKVYKGP